MFSIAEATFRGHLILDVGFVEELELWGYPVLHVGNADGAVAIVGGEGSLGDDGIIIGHDRVVVHDSIVTCYCNDVVMDPRGRSYIAIEQSSDVMMDPNLYSRRSRLRLRLRNNIHGRNFDSHRIDSHSDGQVNTRHRLLLMLLWNLLLCRDLLLLLLLCWEGNSLLLRLLSHHVRASSSPDNTSHNAGIVIIWECETEPP
mmetsp:Transcript_31679/g.57332  ORF Transcript_31679/g.57332 Transcript_31679/m.57332 type:complete len:201 (-) Transcript_31679:981-1583(-)